MVPGALKSKAVEQRSGMTTAAGSSRAYRRTLLQSGRLVLVCGAYFLAGHYGLAAFAVHTFAPLVWPAAGIAVASLVLWGSGMLPAIALGAFLVDLAAGAPISVALFIAIGNAGSAYLAYALLRRLNFDPLFARQSDALGFIGVAFVASGVSATIGLFAVYAGGVITGTQIADTWVSWWIGNLLGILSFAPFFLRWGEHIRFERSTTRWLEGLAGFGTMSALIILITWTPYRAIGSLSLLFPLLLALTWAGLRTGTRGMTLTLFLLSTLGLSGIIYGQGPETAGLTEQSLFTTQAFIGTLDIIFLVFVSLVEERRRAVAALQSHVTDLELALQKTQLKDRAKNDFITVLAHELRNPLSAILSSLELMRANGVSRENAPTADTMLTHVNIMARLLDDLLDTARISQKNFRLQKEPVNVAGALRQALEIADAYLSGRSHEVVISLPNEPLAVLADPVRLSQILVNLLTNAGKYTDAGGTIRASVARDGRQVVFTVSDDGIGIPRKRLAHIFEPAYTERSGRDVVRRAGGLGIGLSLAKRLVELHGGSIRAESLGPGKGSTFTVRLPLYESKPLDLPDLPSAAWHRQQRPERATSGKAKPLRILIVDDNEPVAKGLAKLLAKRGHETHACMDAGEALSRADKFPPDVILLDIDLPTMTGYELAKQLRQSGCQAMLIALTGYGLEQDRRKAFASGFAHHLTKPVSAADIESLLETVPRSR